MSCADETLTRRVFAQALADRADKENTETITGFAVADALYHLSELVHSGNWPPMDKAEEAS